MHTRKLCRALPKFAVARFLNLVPCFCKPKDIKSTLMPWKFFGIASVVAVLIWGSGTVSSQTLLLELPDKQFYLTDSEFVYSNLTQICEASGLDVGLIDTNAQYSLLQAAIFDLMGLTLYEIWIYVNTSPGGGVNIYWWGQEEVAREMWWMIEPNYFGFPPPGLNNSDCMGFSQECRPVQMRRTYYSIGDVDLPLLMDVCCWSSAKGICMKDVDECLTPSSNNCSADSVCSNLNYTYICECLPGFREFNEECQDIDECADNSTYTCPVNTVCNNTHGSYHCPCAKGYVFVFIFEECQDVNECSDPETFPCPTQSTCENTAGSYICQCDLGYQDNQHGQCQDVDECHNPVNFSCQAHSSCENTAGSYLCLCDLGYQDDQHGQCQDIDECQEPLIAFCPAKRRCNNTEGSYDCVCKDGYREGPLGNCRDIDECQAPSSYVCPTNSACNNTAGSYNCQCLEGFQEDTFGKCQDIDECQEPSIASCPATRTCNNTEGSYVCVCKDGYQENLYWECEDIVECEDPTSYVCPANSVCNNTEGSYSCQCLEGYLENSSGECQVETTTTSSTRDLCQCECPKGISNFTQYPGQALRDIQQRLLVDTTSLSSHVRRLTSAEDNRTTSVCVGTSAVGLLVFAVAVVTLPDAINVWLCVRRYAK